MTLLDLHSEVISPEKFIRIDYGLSHDFTLDGCSKPNIDYKLQLIGPRSAGRN